MLMTRNKLALIVGCTTQHTRLDQSKEQKVTTNTTNIEFSVAAEGSEQVAHDTLAVFDTLGEAQDYVKMLSEHYTDVSLMCTEETKHEFGGSSHVLYLYMYKNGVKQP